MQAAAMPIMSNWLRYFVFLGCDAALPGKRFLTFPKDRIPRLHHFENFKTRKLPLSSWLACSLNLGFHVIVSYCKTFVQWEG